MEIENLEEIIKEIFKRECENNGFKISKISTRTSGLITYWTVTMYKKIPFLATGFTRVSRGFPIYVDGKFILADVYTFYKKKIDTEYVLIRVYGDQNPIETGLKAFVESVFSKYVNKYEARTKIVHLKISKRSVSYVYVDGESAKISTSELKAMLRNHIESDLSKVFI